MGLRGEKERNLFIVSQWKLEHYLELAKPYLLLDPKPQLYARQIFNDDWGSDLVWAAPSQPSCPYLREAEISGNIIVYTYIWEEKNDYYWHYLLSDIIEAGEETSNYNREKANIDAPIYNFMPWRLKSLGVGLKEICNILVCINIYSVTFNEGCISNHVRLRYVKQEKYIVTV